MYTVTAATIGGAVLFGMSQALLGRLKLAMARRGTAEDGQIRRALLVLNVAVVPLILLCGVLTDYCGARLMLVAGSVALAMGLVSVSLRPTHPHVLPALLVAAFGAAALGTASTVLMPRAFFTPEEIAASLNLGYVFIALGALLAPVLTDVLLQTLELRRTLALLALLALLPAFLAVLPGSEPPNEPPVSGAFFADPAGWLAMLVLLFYAPLEAAISLWTFTLLAQRGQDEREATSLLSGFWAAFLASRLLVALAQHLNYLTQWWDRSLIVVLPLVAAVVLVLPTLLGTIFRHVASAERGTVYGLVFAAGSLGSAALAPFLKLRTRPPLQAALRVPIFLALFVTAIALVWGLMMP
jgi:MFS family permease